MTELTLFSAPKPFTNPHIAVIQRNAIRTWLELGMDVEVVLLGEEVGLAETAKSLGVRHISNIKRNSSGTPLISSLFDAARQLNSSPMFACVNADILLLPDFLTTARKTLQITNQFLLIGQRWDLEITKDLDFSTGWQERLKQECTEKGNLHKPTGSDYFIFPRPCFQKIPDFAIGRAGWDNWMIYESRRQGWTTIDATQKIQIIHQNHDYSHLPGGQTHYRLPETDENIRLAGGRRAIFTLADADYCFVDDKIKENKLTRERFWREVEIYPLIRLRSRWLAYIFFVFFHPKRALYEFRTLRAKNRKRSG